MQCDFGAAYTELVCNNFVRNCQRLRAQMRPGAQVNLPTVQDIQSRLTKLESRCELLSEHVSEQQLLLAQSVLGG
jgi:hypothetical protein